jgi:serine/threonine protein kinase/Tol biopolymer transport system component
MTPERWQMVRGILQSAMEMRPQERVAFLDRECAADLSLRQDVDKMLSVEGKLDPDFLELPAAEQVDLPPLTDTRHMAVPAGTRFGNYELHGLLGIGGMGQVYRARDLLLKREVAVKIIPHFYASDPARLHRFKLEAEATALLNHPNILTVYQVGEHDQTFYIVAELLQGETLRERVKTGPLPLRVATDYGVQIARGLTAAQENGVIHRDLKPENIFVTKDGRIKILDFGLAKLIDQRLEGQSRKETESLVKQWTEAGMAMGTASYMSPEQVRGIRIDHRSDIFAFGAVLYEMLTGSLAFSKTTAAETMTAILNEDPPALSEGAQNIPQALQRIVQRCLEKQPEQRFQSASDLAFALEALSQSGSGSVVPVAEASRSRWRWKVATGVSIMAVGLAIAWWWIPPAVPIVESVTQITNDGELKFGGFDDGSRIYFQEGNPGAFRLVQVSSFGGRTVPFEHSLPNLNIMGLARDGSELLLRGTSQGDGTTYLYSLQLPSGEPRKLLEDRYLITADLFPDGHIVYSLGDKDNTHSELMIAERDGSQPRRIRSFAGLIDVIWVSPEGRRILYMLHEKENASLRTILPDGTDEEQILTNINLSQRCCFEWSGDRRYILFSQRTTTQSDIWALPLERGLFHRRTEPVRLTAGPLYYGEPIASRDGKRIFTVGIKQRAELVRLDPKSHQFVPVLPGVSAIEPSFSNDGKWMAYLAFPDMTIWRSRTDGSERTQLTFLPTTAWGLYLSPDGSQVSFTTVGGTCYLVGVSAGQPRKLSDHDMGGIWSPDGKRLAFTSRSEKSFWIRIADVATETFTDIPSSSGKVGPWWTGPSTLVAFEYGRSRFVMFDLATERWTDLPPTDDPPSAWGVSPDKKYLYYTTGGKELELHRIRLSDRTLETVAGLKDLRLAANPITGGAGFSIAPDGSIVFSRDLSSQEIYALNVRWP